VVSASAMMTRAIATILHQWISASFISLFWSFSQNVAWPLYIYKKKEVGLHSGLPGFAGSRIDLPGRPGFTRPTLRRVFLRSRPVPCLGQSGPGSTRQTGPSFKTMTCVATVWIACSIIPRCLCTVLCVTDFIVVGYGLVIWWVN